jgi:hypothetical protein
MRLPDVVNAKLCPDSDVTGLLHAWRCGDNNARDRLLTVVYPELRRLLGRPRCSHRLHGPSRPPRLTSCS